MVELGTGNKVPYLRPEGRLNLRDGAAEVDPAPPRRYLVDREAVPLEPAEDGVQVRVREAEFTPVLLGCQPAVVVRRGAIELLGEEAFEPVGGAGPWPEHEDHLLDRESAVRRADVDGPQEPRRDVPGDRDRVGVVHDARRGRAQGKGDDAGGGEEKCANKRPAPLRRDVFVARNVPGRIHWTAGRMLHAAISSDAARALWADVIFRTSTVLAQVVDADTSGTVVNSSVNPSATGQSV